VARLQQEIRRCLTIEIATQGVYERWAEIQTGLQANGRTIGQNDLWIAATASVTGLTLLTMDRDFEEVRRLGLLSVVMLDANTGLRV